MEHRKRKRKQNIESEDEGNYKTEAKNFGMKVYATDTIKLS